jgi:transposase
MTRAYRMSKRMVQTFCTDVLGVPVCAGQVCASEAETAAATAAVVGELREYARCQPANVDETGWWQRRRRGWLWAVVTRSVTAFTIALSRAGSVAQGLVDPSAGQVITTNRYKGYLWLPLRRRQICWAHTIRTQSLGRFPRLVYHGSRSIAGAFRRCRSGLRPQAA